MVYCMVPLKRRGTCDSGQITCKYKIQNWINDGWIKLRSWNREIFISKWSKSCDENSRFNTEHTQTARFPSLKLGKFWSLNKNKTAQAAESKTKNNEFVASESESGNANIWKKWSKPLPPSLHLQYFEKNFDKFRFNIYSDIAWNAINMSETAFEKFIPKIQNRLCISLSISKRIEAFFCDLSDGAFTSSNHIPTGLQCFPLRRNTEM